MAKEADDRSRLTSQRQKDFGSTNREKDGITDEDAKRKRYEEWLMPVAAEFVSTLLFAFMHCMGRHSLPLVATGIINGFFVAVMIITIGHISGAHMNVAVTIAATLAGGLKWAMAPLYIIVQLIGSTCGAALAKVALGSASGAFALGEGVSVGQAVLTEVMMTLLLVFTILQSAVDLASPNAAFAVGFSILIDVLIGGKITGACMNPTLSFGPAIISEAWDNYWIYWVAPIVGALIAVVLYKFAFASAKNRAIYLGNETDHEDTRNSGATSSDSNI